ncbi:MAG: ABC transporter permease [Lachnospiraceae bacterium]|jgi:ribose transport system permease protein|nr:ABC transporter permease [Lachnospiraceae bacterium]
MKKKFSVEKYSRIVILLLFTVVLTIIRPKSFPTVNNISNVLWSISVVGILVSGSIFVMLLGGIDLSVGSLMGLSAVVTVLTIRNNNYTNKGVILGIALALLVGVAAGALHGFFVITFHVPAFLVTFATQSIFLGISMVLTNNKILSCLEPKLFTNIGLGRMGPFTFPIYFMVIIALLSFFVLNKTVLGRHIYAVGGNQEASRISGISVKKITMISYIISSFTAALGGIVLASMTQQGMASTGVGYDTEVITAAVIGGVSLAGGAGTIQGTMIGAMFVGLLKNGMNLMNVPSTNQGLVKGLVIICAVALDIMQKKEKNIHLPFLKKKKIGGNV